MPETTESFGEWLRGQYVSWAYKTATKNNRMPSQADFAKWLGMPPTTVSNIMNDLRKPSPEAVHLLADKLGTEVYDRLDLPRRMPRNKMLRYLADHWAKLPEQQQKELYERAQNMLEEQKEGEAGETFNALAA